MIVSPRHKMRRRTAVTDRATAIREEIADINLRIANASQWGGSIPDLNERRKGLEAELRQLEGGAA